MKIESLNQYSFIISIVRSLGLAGLTVLVVGILNNDILHFIPSSMGITFMAMGIFVIPIALLIIKNLQTSKKKMAAYIAEQRISLNDDALSTKYIANKKSIYNLTNINGLSLEEIEKRAYPKNYDETEKWKSSTGFLGPREKLKNVLLQDWEVVQKAGWTHQELADRLHEIVNIAFQYSPAQDYVIKYRNQKLRVRHNRNGTQNQECLFNLYLPWNGHCRITHVETGAQILWTLGCERYIRDFGFYEGGLTEYNDFRIDPIELITILTGEPVENLKKRLGSKYPKDLAF